MPKRARVPNAENGGQRSIEKKVAKELLRQNLDRFCRGIKAQNCENDLDQQRADKQRDGRRAEED
jgi:hypothetical protein